jgi:hypothetical protein
MFHPVGSQPPSVYWRRRLFVLGSVALVILLIALTIKIAAGGSDSPQGTGHTTPLATAPTAPQTTTQSSTRPRTSSQTPTSPQRDGSSHRSSTAPAACVPQDLSVQAVVGRSSYEVGAHPVLELQVTNTGPGPCVEDLADKQIELRVYNGESRVWGSHDCQIEPGTNDRTLAVNQPVRVAITWSGLTSQPGCAGTRQRVGAGTYTLYALLSGKTGKAAQFTIG